MTGSRVGSSPGAELLPVQRLHRTLAAVARRAGRDAIAYDPPPGCAPLRRQLARRALDWGCTLGPEEFIVTTGALEAISLGLRAVCRPGDVVALESPTYFGHLQCLESLGSRALEIPTHPREGMDLDRLEAALRSRQRVAAVLAAPNFNNPLGGRMPDEHKRQLVELLARREIPLVEDDTNGDLGFGPGPRPRTAKSFDARGLVLLCGSVSKSLAPGWRVGWMVRGAVRGRGAASPARLHAGGGDAAGAGRGGVLADGRLRPSPARVAHRVRRAGGAGVPRGGGCVPARHPVDAAGGDFVLWVELPAGVDALELHARALAAGVSLAAGPIFSAKPGNFAGFIRLSCGHPWSPRLAGGIETLGRLVERMVPRGVNKT